MGEPLQPRSAWSLITEGSFSRLWWASVVSSTGDWITIFATIALGNQIAGGQGVLVAIFARIIPGLVFGPAVGVLTDRFDRRRLIVIADIGRGFVVLLLLFASTLPILVLVTILSEFLSLLGQSPRAAIVPRLVHEVNIVNANSLILGATYGTIPLGAAFNFVLSGLPALTLGVLIPPETSDFAWAFLLDSLTYLVSGLIVATLPKLETKIAEARRTQSDQASSSTGDLRDGWRFLLKTGSVRRVILSISAALFGGGVIIAVGPTFVEEVLQADSAGFFAVVTMLGLGAAVGIGAMSLFSDSLTRRDVVFAAFTLMTGVGLIAASLTGTVIGASLWIMVMGFGAGSAYVMGLTHLHEEVDDEMRGRVFAALFALMRVALFISMAVAVPLDTALGGAGVSSPARFVLLFGGLVILGSAMLTMWSLRSVLRAPKLGSDARAVLEHTTKAYRGESRHEPIDPEDDLE
jgi:dTMP kinase